MIPSKNEIEQSDQIAKEKLTTGECNISTYERYCIRCEKVFSRETVIRKPELYCEDCKHLMRLSLG